MRVSAGRAGPLRTPLGRERAGPSRPAGPQNSRGTPDLLFVYGTLMRGFQRHRLLRGRSEDLGAGVVAGRLLDLGRYPGAVPDPRATVRGEVYRILDAALWGALDSAEGPQYHRDVATVRTADRRALRAFVYWYVGPLDRATPIPGGEYRAHVPAHSIPSAPGNRGARK